MIPSSTCIWRFDMCIEHLRGQILLLLALQLPASAAAGDVGHHTCHGTLCHCWPPGQPCHHPRYDPQKPYHSGNCSKLYVERRVTMHRTHCGLNVHLPYFSGGNHMQNCMGGFIKQCRLAATTNLCAYTKCHQDFSSIQQVNALKMPSVCAIHSCCMLCA